MSTLEPKALRRELDAVVAQLIAPLLNAAPTAAWKLVSWDVEQGICISVAKGDRWLLVELEPRDDHKDCFARTARFNVTVRLQLAEGASLNDEEVRVARHVVEMIRRREGLLPRPARAVATRGSEVREIHVERMLVPQGPGHYYLNAYVGCMIGCEFCYVADRADMSRELEGRSRLPWGRYVDVKVNGPEVLRRELQATTPGIVRMSPILTDPYQPLERRYRITRGCIEAMVGTGFTPGVLTRAARIVDDLELIASFPRAAIGVSVPTDDDAIREAFEPGGDPIEARLEALAAFRRAGVRTVAVVQPVLPMNPERLAALLAPHASLVRIDRMYEVPRVEHLYARAGRRDAATDAFYHATSARLRSALLERGVRLDTLDDLGNVFE
jgi:DNA repair photolyase